MKATYSGLMTVDDFYQAFFQDREFFRRHGITHIRKASLYFTPCDEQGRPVTICDQAGGAIDGYETAGCYHSLADAYEAAGDLEPKTVCRKTNRVVRGGNADSFRFTPG
jgi:hypothetical protein